MKRIELSFVLALGTLALFVASESYQAATSPHRTRTVSSGAVAALSSAEEVRLEDLKARPFAQRLVERITWLGSPYL